MNNLFCVVTQHYINVGLRKAFTQPTQNCDRTSMSKIVLSKKFKKSFRKFASRNQDLQERIEETIIAMENDVFSTNLGTHKLEGKLSGLLS